MLFATTLEAYIINNYALPGRNRSMAFDENLATRIRVALARKKGVEEKKMFGGVGFLLNGNMLVGVWKDSLIVRLGPDNYDDALLEPHVREFDITGKPMKGWIMVEPEGVEDDDQLKDWIERALKFVKTLPAKEK
jgi:TfoX/Sxy family transcriptional regulator of competence genes